MQTIYKLVFDVDAGCVCFVKITFIKDNLLLLDSFLLKTTYLSLYLLL